MLRSFVLIALVCVVPCASLRAETGVSDALTKSQKALDAANGQVAAANKEAAQAKVAIKKDGSLPDTQLIKSKQADKAQAAVDKAHAQHGKAAADAAAAVDAGNALANAASK